MLFKYHNQKGLTAFQEANYQSAKNNFQQAISFAPHWSLLAETNSAAATYATKDYTQAKTKYTELIQANCNLTSSQIISPLCENLFYGLGNTLYRLGEKTDTKTQKQQWKTAIENYQKSLQINPNNTWAQENIDFIQKRLIESANQNNSDKQESNTEENNQTSPQAEKNQSQDQTNSNNQQAANQTKSTTTKSNSNDTQKQNDTTNNSTSTSNNTNQTENSNIQNTAPTPSRLPAQIQKELEAYQKELEQNETQNQDYFQRNPHAQSPQNYDPFNAIFQNDPFFQDLFENDPLTQQFFNNTNPHFNQNLTDPNEKDW